MQFPHLKQIKFHQLHRAEGYTLKGRCNAQQLQMHLQLKQPNRSFIFKTATKDSQLAKLLDLFSNNEEILEYLAQAENIKINELSNGSKNDQETMSVSILGKHPTKRQQYLVLHTLTFNQYKSQGKLSSIDQLDQLVSIINSDAGQKIQDKLKELANVLINKIKQIQNKIIGVAQFQRVIKKIEYMGENIQGFNMKISDLYAQHQNIIDRNNTLQQKIAKVKEIFSNSLQNQSERIKQQIKGVVLQNDKKLEKLYTVLETQQEIIKAMRQRLILNPIKNVEGKYQKEEQIQMRNQKQLGKKIEQSEFADKQKLEDIRNQIEQSAKFYKHFQIRGINITKEEDFIFPTILIGSKPLRICNQFCIKISRMGILKKIYPGICVGVINSALKHKQSCDNGDSVIEYSCAGKLFQGNKFIVTEGKGYQTGNIIRVHVDFESSTITWLVNDKIECKYCSKHLKNRDIDWRPYVFMRDKGDSIDWIVKY